MGLLFSAPTAVSLSTKFNNNLFATFVPRTRALPRQDPPLELLRPGACACDGIGWPFSDSGIAFKSGGTFPGKRLVLMPPRLTRSSEKLEALRFELYGRTVLYEFPSV